MMPPRIARAFFACTLFFASAAISSGQLSDKTRAEIVAAFPKYTPLPADQPPPATTTPAPLSDDPVVNLPDYHIKEKRLLAKDPDLWLSRRALDRNAMSDYSDSMTDLEWALNCWYIPGVTPRPRDLANARYASKKSAAEQKRLISIADTLSRLDSAEAKKLRRDLDFSRHPGK